MECSFDDSKYDAKAFFCIWWKSHYSVYLFRLKLISRIFWIDRLIRRFDFLRTCVCALRHTAFFFDRCQKNILHCDVFDVLKSDGNGHLFIIININLNHIKDYNPFIVSKNEFDAGKLSLDVKEHRKTFQCIRCVYRFFLIARCRWHFIFNGNYSFHC